MALSIVSRGNFISHGRLTLVTNTPVLSTDQTSIGTIYYAPYVGTLVSLWSGTEYLTYTFAELSQALTDDTKSPAAAAADSVYDMFVWNDAGTLRCTRGPAWSSATSRGTGAGTSQLGRIGGTWLNQVAITNGPAAQRGTYVGTIATNAGAATVNMAFNPAAAAGGSNNYLGVWNAYNRRPVAAIMREAQNTWNYTLATWRPWNNDEGGVGTNVNNRITFVAGLSEGRIDAQFSVGSSNDNTNILRHGGIGLDSTSAFTGLPALMGGTGNHQIHAVAHLHTPAILGRHSFQCLEYSTATGTSTWRGDSGGSSVIQNGLHFQMEM